MDMAAQRIRTDQWPVVAHVCTDNRIFSLRWHAPARNGIEKACPYCRTIFVYVKPSASRMIAGQYQGGRTHFIFLLTLLLAGVAYAKDPNLADWTADHRRHVEWWNENAVCTCDVRTGHTDVTLGTEALEQTRSEYQRRCDRLCDEYRIRPCEKPRIVCHHTANKRCTFWVREGCEGD